MIPLTGTTDAAHMKADLEVFDFRLEQDEVASMRPWPECNKTRWSDIILP
jgi:diketogulonate reductase-like aldo/keto reductase